MPALVTLLRIAHVLLFVLLGVFIWGSWRVAKYKNPSASIWPHLLLGILFFLLFGLVIHAVCGVKTKLGYALGANEKPQYTLY